MEAKFNLPLDLNENKNLKTFLVALDNTETYETLSENKESLPKTAQEILSMLDDPEFKKTSNDLAKKYFQVRSGKLSVEDLKKEGRSFHDYLTNKYPVGYKRLQECGNELFSKELKSFDTEVSSDVAIATEAIVSAAVWANVAAVTNVAVALEAVVSIGVFVV